MVTSGSVKRRIVLWVYGAVSAVLVLLGPVVYLAPYYDSNFGMSVLLRWSWILACLVLLASFYSTWFRFGVVESQPGESLAGLTRMLRVMGYNVEQKKEFLDVRIDKLAHVKIRAKRQPRGTEIGFQVGVTPLYAAAIIVLFLVIPPASVLLSLFAMRSSFRFIDEKLSHRLTGLPAVASAPMDVHATLVDSLSEGRRLAQEAYEAAKSNYEDTVIVLVIVGVAFFMGAFLAGLWVIPDGHDSIRLTSSAILGALAMVGVILPTFLKTRKRQLTAIRQFEEHAKRLADALAIELSSGKPPDGYPSSFEIIAGAGDQIPVWLAARRQAGAYRHPTTWIAIFVFAYAGALLTVAAVAEMLSDWDDPARNGVVLAIGCVMLVSTLSLYRRWRKEERLESEQVTGDWRGRLEVLRSEMEKYLQGL